MRRLCIVLAFAIAGAVAARVLQGCLDAGPGPAIVTAPADRAL